MRLAGKVALISGGARGMGAAEARMFAREGAKVIIGDVLEAEGRQVEAEITEAGGEARFVNLDVTSEYSWDAAVQAAVARFGKLDVLVNNAGIVARGHLLDSSLDEWNRVMNVNSTGVYLGTKTAIPEMLKAGGGSIVNISSMSGMVGQDYVTGLQRLQRRRPHLHQVGGGAVRPPGHPHQFGASRPHRHAHGRRPPHRRGLAAAGR